MSNIQYFFLFITIFVLLLLFYSNNLFQDTSTEKQFVNIGTASISGVYYPVGGILCKLVNKLDKNMKCSVQSTPGTVYNLNALRTRDIDVGFAQADAEYNAYHSLGIFDDKRPMTELRTLFLVHSDVFTVVVRQDSNIKKFDDIKHQRVNIGAPGTGVRSTMTQLMDIKGWKENDFKLSTDLKSSEQAQSLCDNKIDVMIDVIGHPSGAVQEASATCDTMILPIDKETIDALIAKHPYYGHHIIPGGIYPGTENDINTFSVRTSVLSTTNVDDEIIYNLVKAAFKGFKLIKSSRPVFAHLTKKDMVDTNTAPLHNGAIKYYKEVGLL